MTQLQDTLTLINQQSSITSDILGVYTPHTQRYIQSLLQGNVVSDMQVFIKQFAQLFIWLQHSGTCNPEEEVEMKEIEKSLLG